MLKGVNNIVVTNDEEISDEWMAVQMAASRKSGKGDKDKALNMLKKITVQYNDNLNKKFP